MSVFSRSELAGSDIVFLLEINFLGQVWYFSSLPIQLGEKSYIGGLDDVEFVQEANPQSVALQKNSASMAICFDGIDLTQQWRKGRSLEGCAGELSYVLFRDDVVQQDYDERITILSGIVQLPVFGDPLEPVGFVAFSLESKPYDLSQPLISKTQIITAENFPDHDESTAGGKKYPIVIGSPGIARNAVGSTIEMFATPAYNIKRFVSPSSNSVHFLIAGHEVLATTVKLSDTAGNIISLPVLKKMDSLGNVYSYVDATGSVILYPNKVGVVSPDSTSKEFWICWAGGGGLRSPYGDDALSGGGDICRWALQMSGVKIDHGAWQNISEVLNQYQFAGYINDDSSSWDWVRSNIIKYLPILVKSGPNGIRPILQQLWAFQYAQPIASVIEGRSFAQLSAISTATDTSQLINAYALNFAKDGIHRSYSMRARISSAAENTDSDRQSIYSVSSNNRYGLIEQAEATDYVYDRQTAFRIAHTMIKSKSFPTRVIEFAADVEFGFLQIGDVIQITSEALHMTDQKCTVIMLSWQGDHWTVGLSFNDNPIDMERAT